MSDDAESGKWLKVKARMPMNAKVIALSDQAFRLHFSVSCWCCEEVNDGRFAAHVPSGMPKAPTPKKLPAVVKELVDAGLWKPTPGGGYEINDFLKYNMSRAQWEAMKAAGREGGRRSGESRRRNREAPAEGGGSGGASGPPSPIPRPHPEHDNDHEGRNRKPPPPKDPSGSARAPTPRAAAAAQDFGSEPQEKAFADALSEHWHSCTLESDQALVGFVRADVADGAPEALLAELGIALARWLKAPTPSGAARTLGMVSQKVYDHAREEALGKLRDRAARAAEIRKQSPRKSTPPPMSTTEILAAAARAQEVCGAN